MDTTELSRLLEAYRQAPPEFHATRYWQTYEKPLLEALAAMDFDRMRSGRYPILATFGFNDTVYFNHPNLSWWKRFTRGLVHRWASRKRWLMPYGLDVPAIRDLAYRHCELYGSLTGARPISSIAMSDAGGPGDLFEVGGRKYSIKFLDYYLRYCFANRHVALRGDEVIVELGSGSGHQVEVLKKLYPGLTILCFDLPAQLFLCQAYLSAALGAAHVVGTQQTLGWKDLSGVRKGAVHFFGNWQMPLLNGLRFDLFWNAASFGEMEPAVVKNYLSFVKGQARWVYLLQARHGKSLTAKARVQQQITFDDYAGLLDGYELLAEQDVYLSQRRLTEAGGYFEAVWRAKA